jgi:hypothetical protein
VRRIIALLIALSAALSAWAAELKPTTTKVFDSYVASAERVMDADLRSGDFLMPDKSAERDGLYRELRSGTILINQVNNTSNVPDGLIHHWIAIAFVPGAHLEQVLSLVQDYDHLPAYYSPEVLRSRLVSHDGNHFSISMRVRKKKMVTAILDTDYDVHFYSLSTTHVYSVSRSTRVAEIDNVGTPNEHARPQADDHGFLWRMNSYWRFEQVNDGTFIQCEAISLTRDIPSGLGWLIGPFITKIPEESLRFTLEATRSAIAHKIAKPADSYATATVQRETQ